MAILTKDMEIKAVSNVVYELEKDIEKRINGFVLLFGGHVIQPEKVQSLAEFTIALTEQKHKKWDIFKKEVNKLRLNEFKGRAIPQRNCKPKGNMQVTKLLNPKPMFYGRLDFDKCRTKVDRVKLILGSDAPAEVKRDLLAFHMK